MQAVTLLRDGEIVALPTETVYGLGACALNADACAKIFEAKQRPLHDPLIVHIPDIAWLERLAEIDEQTLQLATRFWPGPLTLLLKKRPIVPDLVTAGLDTVAIRMSAHPLFSEVAQRLGEPIAAPSANRFGRISPTSAAHVMQELGGRFALILDGGECCHGVESTIYHAPTRRIFRPGPITAEDLGASDSEGGKIVVPGSMPSHYAPRTPLVLECGGKPCALSNGRLGLLTWSAATILAGDFAAQEILSVSGDLREAAANLYGAMRRLDALALDAILAVPPPETGIGRAICDRLRRAACGSGQ